MKLVNIEGQPVPDVTIRAREAGEWQEINTGDIFAGKTVIVFSLPGAFTPTCSSSHLPRYEELHGAFQQSGVDDILCVSVNDAFVMDAWAREQDATHVRMLPDGNGDFTRGMGMLVDKRDLGFGQRSWRYSMLVRDGIVEKMFIEPEQPGDPFEVSDADTMLAYVSPNIGKPKSVSVFSKPGCPHCVRAKKLLKAYGMGYEEVVLGRDATVRTLRAVAGTETVPQIFIEGVHVGGADDLEQYLSDARAA